VDVEELRKKQQETDDLKKQLAAEIDRKNKVMQH
jgi:hypothetical protein